MLLTLMNKWMHAPTFSDNDLLDGRAPSIGRITGSNSIETLVRVGLEKENGIPSDSKMIVLHDFTPCVDDELEVKRGQIVTVLYQENDWVYVIRESDAGSSSNSEGFIPYSYCTPVSSQLADMVIKHKKIPRSTADSISLYHNLVAGGSAGLGNGSNHSSENNHNANVNHYHTFNQLMHASSNNSKDLLITTGKGKGSSSNAATTIGPILTNTASNPAAAAALLHHHQQQSIMLMHHHHLTCNSDSDPGKDVDSYSGAASDIHPFFKDPSGHRFIVLYNFIARDENDINVERGEFVTVLNMDDPDWYWILRSDGLEGFVPSSFLCSLDPDSMTGAKKKLQQQQSSPSQSINPVTNSGSGSMSNGLQEQQQAPSNGILMSNHAANNNNNNHLLINNNATNTTEESTTTYSNSIDGGNSQHGVPIICSSQERGFLADELVMLYDYKAQAPDDLSVRRGDWVYADLKEQKIDGWIWAFAPKLKKYGFIPKAYARPPAMTSI